MMLPAFSSCTIQLIDILVFLLFFLVGSFISPQENKLNKENKIIFFFEKGTNTIYSLF